MGIKTASFGDGEGLVPLAYLYDMCLKYHVLGIWASQFDLLTN